MIGKLRMLNNKFPYGRWVRPHVTLINSKNRKVKMVIFMKTNFFDVCVENLISAVAAYKEETQTSEMTLNPENPLADLDGKFTALAEKNSDSYAVRQYQVFRKASENVCEKIIEAAGLM